MYQAPSSDPVEKKGGVIHPQPRPTKPPVAPKPPHLQALQLRRPSSRPPAIEGSSSKSGTKSGSRTELDIFAARLALGYVNLRHQGQRRVIPRPLSSEYEVRQRSRNVSSSQHTDHKARARSHSFKIVREASERADAARDNDGHQDDANSVCDKCGQTFQDLRRFWRHYEKCK